MLISYHENTDTILILQDGRKYGDEYMAELDYIGAKQLIKSLIEYAHLYIVNLS